MSRILGTSLSAIALLVFLSSAARAEVFTAYLTGAQEAPAIATTATGYARIVVNETTGSLTFTVVFNGLSSTQTLSHIHAPAPIGVSTGVAINFGTVGGTSGTISGTTTITPTQLAQLRQHLGYVNVHSMNNPSGEIRGQLGVTRPVDFDGDGRTDPSVLRFPNVAPPGLSSITWWNANSTAGVQVVNNWGNANTDFPVPGDYDGDGTCDFGIYRDGATVGAQSEFWILISTTNTVRYYAWGLNGDEAVQRDFDGDGITDVAIFRRGPTADTQTRWYIRESSTGNARIVGFGLTGDQVSSGDFPIPGDYDGDGKFDIAVYRVGQTPNNNYIILRSSDGAITYQQFGNFNTDYIVPGDYDGDGKYDFAVARTGATGTSPLIWWILQSSTGTTRTQVFGISSDLPTQGEYDGDARTDIGVYRRGATTGAQSVFWIFNSFTLTARNTPWGVREDFSVNTFDTR